MIHKFLIVGKQVMFSSVKLEDEHQSLYNIDLLMPLDVYWEISELLRLSNYLYASDEQMADIHEIYKEIFRKSAPHAVFENDRTWLYQHGIQRGLGAG